MKYVIVKIELTPEQQDEVDKIKNNEPIKRTRIAYNKRGFQYEVTTRNKPITPEVAKRRLLQFYGGICTGCGKEWPDYKVTYDVGDERQPAKRIERYCEKCFSKRKDGIEWKKKEKN
ncbi:MAG TPA: hypothetical protein VD710_05285 [Nitrososphaeraceae archaeon]|nr:hypothetical protein [Nitrososphaeraceae archaeon]